MGAGACSASLTSTTRYVYASLARPVRRIGLTRTQKIKDDPSSEERQGKNLVDAALANGVQCFVWSTLPSSHAISRGRLVSQIYEGTLGCMAAYSCRPRTDECQGNTTSTTTSVQRAAQPCSCTPGTSTRTWCSARTCGITASSTASSFTKQSSRIPRSVRITIVPLELC